MSTEAVTGAVSGMPPSEAAALARVRQLEALIQASRQVASGGASVPGGFASALQAASGDGAAPIAQAAGGEGSQSTPYDALIDQAAARNGIDPALLHGLIQQESDFDPSSVSSAGAAGLTQLMPGTASSLGVANPLDPAESIEGGARYLSQMLARFGGDTGEALAAYNAGPGAVHRYGGIPPYAETQGYVQKVLGYAEAYRRSHPPAPAAPPVRGLAAKVMGEADAYRRSHQVVRGLAAEVLSHADGDPGSHQRAVSEVRA